ncbi:MAG: hypothetical protein P4M06_18300 [Pandoraea sp.]|nr:hypothetical protein [Pandoraea sp.]MDR3399501.1 hypothetical protein [Pandoraea sp.]
MTKSGNVREVGNGDAPPVIWPPWRHTAAILPRVATRDIAKALGVHSVGLRASDDGVYVALVGL